MWWNRISPCSHVAMVKKNKILVAFDGFNQRFKTCVTLFLTACVPNIYLNRILSREHLQTLLNKSFIENPSI